MARPPADKEAGTRSEVLRVRLAPQEVEAIRFAAEAEGKSVAEFLRGTAVSASASYVPNAQGAAVT